MKQSILRILFVILFLKLMLFLPACSSKVVRMARTDGTEIDSYKLRPGDILELKFEYYPEFNQTVLIHTDGTVALRGLGEIKVIDLTPDFLESLLNKKYSNMLAEPKIDIDVKESTKFKVYFSGDIKHPGIVNFRGNLSVTKGIYLAGGLKDKSTDYEITIFRSTLGSKVKMYKFYLKKNSKRDKEISNFKLAPYDVVVILKSSGKKKNSTRHI